MQETTFNRSDALPKKSGIAPLSEKVLNTFRKEYPYIDVYFVESEWRRWAADKEPPNNPDGSFLNFARKYMDRQKYFDF